MALPDDGDLAPTRESVHVSEERFRLLIESVKDYAIFMLDAQGRVATWNLGAERIKGYRADEIIGQHFSRFYPLEEVRGGKCEYELEHASLEGRFEDEGWRVRKDGSRFWANVVITALRDASGTVVGFAKVTRDLTERRAAEQERLRLGQLARERIQVLAGLADALTAALSVEHVGQVVSERAITFTQADTCTLYLVDERTRVLELVAQRGCNPAVVDHIGRVGPDSGNPTYAIGMGQAPAVWIENAEQYDAFFPALARLDVPGKRSQSFWCVPLIAEGRAIGMLAVGFLAPRQFNDEEREFVDTFARQCAQALARARRLELERAAAQMAERLRASLATTLRSIGDALISTDAAGDITLMNGVAEALTGFSEAEARGRPLLDVFRVVNEHTREPIPNPVELVLKTGSVVGLANHSVLLTRDGREIPIDDSGAPIRGDNSHIEGVVLVFRDVTQRKREESRRSFLADAAAVLAESLDYEATLARVAQLAVPRFADWCAVDLVSEDNTSSKRLALAHNDPDRLELAKQLYSKYVPPADAVSGPTRVLRSGRAELYPTIPAELMEKLCADPAQLAALRSLHLSSAMLVPLINRGHVLGVMSFVFAQSGRRYSDADLQFGSELAERCANAIENARMYRSEQQARRSADLANRAKDEFLAVVSHELRTPLNAILGWAKMLTSRALDEHRQKSALDTIERNAVAMAQLIEDLLDMSRVISGKLRIDVQPVDIARVVDAAIESIRPAALAKGIEIAVHQEPTLASLSGDPTRLQQVVWNLLSNAVKFSSKSGRVEVFVQSADSAIQIRVRDSGRGIAASFLPNVFEPFRQEDASPSRTRGGLGLGLAITRQLVELHGGQIVAHSDGEGHGATFTVTLPIAGVEPRSAGSERSVRQFRAGGAFERPDHIRGLRVLVVDDEEDARRLLALVLEDCGCEITMAGSVEEAMRRFLEAPPDVLLSDIAMPGEDGYDLIRKVRALPRDQGGDVPAAALTAYARAEDRRSMLNAGYSIHLAKPVEPAELVAVVAMLSRFLQRSERPPSERSS
ncbi:MAG: PAS domain S-box protein [Myxococcota bacterium]